MSDVVHIPMFPLAILPLPGELVPLHIFEPRYRQLLQDAETNDISFGVFCSHEVNSEKIGSLMKLESVIKRYPSGESDIIVKCQDIFTMDLLMRHYKNKPYPGGDVRFWNADVNCFPGEEMYDAFLEYLTLRNIKQHIAPFNMYQIAIELALDVSDRYKFLLATEQKKEGFLMNRVKFQIHLIKKEDQSKDLYHLN